MSIPSFWTDLLESTDLPATFEEHFSCLATTDECAHLLFEIAQKAQAVEVEEGQLKVHFETADGEEAALYCSPPSHEELDHLPQSLAAILFMFNGLSFPDNDGWCTNLNSVSAGELGTGWEEDFAEDSDELVDAKQVLVPIDNYSDWWLYHPTLQTQQGEPALAFFSHEGGELEEPLSLDFGVGGYFLRLIGHAILGEDDPRCEEYVS
jgi:hypothetical protein